MLAMTTASQGTLGCDCSYTRLHSYSLSQQQSVLELINLTLRSPNQQQSIGYKIYSTALTVTTIKSSFVGSHTGYMQRDSFAGSVLYWSRCTPQLLHKHTVTAGHITDTTDWTAAAEIRTMTKHSATVSASQQAELQLLTASSWIQSDINLLKWIMSINIMSSVTSLLSVASAESFPELTVNYNWTELIDHQKECKTHSERRQKKRKVFRGCCCISVCYI